MKAAPSISLRPPAAFRATGSSRGVRLQRKCACGGTPGPTGECENCRKKRLQRQTRASPAEFQLESSLPTRLTITESAADEAEANAMAERVVAGHTATEAGLHQATQVRGLQRQRRPEDILPQGHVAAAPTMRPVGAEMVRGFPVTRATCGCANETTAREEGIEQRIAAYTSCGQRKDVRDPFALERCVRKKVFGAAAGPKVPALATADPETSTVQIAEADALALREKLLGEPAEGPCVSLRMRAMLVHEGEHLEQFDEIAQNLGAEFFAEFKNLEGDPERLEKLRAKFPNETAKYDNAWQRSVSNNVQAETGAYSAERDFYSEVRSAWSKVCGSTVPSPSVAPPMGTPGRGAGRAQGEKSDLQRSATEGSEANTTQLEVPESVDEVFLRSPGQSLDSSTRSFMEARFGHDFSRVRVHTDARANASADGVNAFAYTVGQNIAFRAGAYAPGTPSGQRLLAHELAHVVQQRGGALAIQRETYYGGAYKQRPFGSLDEEIAAGSRKGGSWHPATPDMAATATGSGGGEAVSTFAELLTKIEAKGPGSITILNLIGHSNSSVFSLGGTITKDDVNFQPDASIESDALSKNADRIAALRNRFATGAKIVLYSCDAGSGQGLLDAIGTAFGVCVEGFTTQIWWCLTKKDGKAVRGRVWALNPKDPIASNDPPNCDYFVSNMTTLPHDGASKQCGAKKAP